MHCRFLPRSAVAQINQKEFRFSKSVSNQSNKQEPLLFSCVLFFTVSKIVTSVVDWFRPALITKMVVSTRHLGDFLASLTKNGYLYWIPQRNISVWNRHSREQIRNSIYACLKVLLGFCNFDIIDKTQPVLRTATLEGGGVFHIFIRELLKIICCCCDHM